MSSVSAVSTCRVFPAFCVPDASGVPDAKLLEGDEFELVGSSAAMMRVRLQVRRIGPHFRSVLVRGEAGTGKERVARALHAMSGWGTGPFIVCRAAMPEGVSVECGTRSGSKHAFRRLIRRAQRGTLFLDGIDEMALEAQGGLLDALKKHEVEQDGVEASRKTDLRVVASTKEDLRILLSTGRFRLELHQRIASVDICLPPLRERVEDLPELATHFLRRFALLHGRGVRRIAEEAVEGMRRYHWPGNVREMEDVLRRGAMQCEGAVFEAHHLPVFKPKGETVNGFENMRLHDVMEQHVLRVLKDCGGNKLRAAELLGISRSTLYRMLDSGASADGIA
jgi:DNA-binding NtrC family response regulator